VKTVGILARADLVEAAPALRDLLRWLRERGVGIAVEARTAVLLEGEPRDGWSVEPLAEVASHADVLVVLGGDGTLLGAAPELSKRQVPVLGVNFGSLGFLTEITLAELSPTLSGVLEGRFSVEERRMLHTVVRRAAAEDAEADVLNDVVITKAALSRIIELDVTVDGVFVSAFRADGLIVSSPTGSTAYNLAAGGPILHPRLAALVLTPICPHMLTNRPLVVTDDSSVEVRLRGGREVEVFATLDGQHGFSLAGDDSVTVTRSPRSLRLVKAPGRDYFQVLRAKLKWGEYTTRRP
jgi:NAD+ kinase